MAHYNRGPEQLTTVREAAVLLGLKECTVRLWMYRGILSRIKLGAKAVRIPVADIARLIDEGRTPTNVAPR